MKEKIETMRQSTFVIAAKSNVGMVRQNNEDNFQCSSNLDRDSMSWINNELCELSPRGALLVVADGMGGMNAGEVASEIAIETVKSLYSPQNITDEVVKTRYTVERFMNSVITEADNRIKQAARENPAVKGMGTTMVQAWLLDKNLYVSWCGDSRAYVFNPLKGLKRLSKDHSLVQELVDSGKISKEDAFDYPDSNVITNCLSAVSQKAVPESLKMPHELEEGDIILLCSDGLCGLIRDSEIQSIIAQNQDDMTSCCDALIKAACNAGGHDNVTVALCKMVSLKGTVREEENVEENISGRKTWIKWGTVLAILAAAFCLWWFVIKDYDYKSSESPVQPTAKEDDTSTSPKNNCNFYQSGNSGEVCTDDVSARLTAKNELIIIVEKVDYVHFQSFDKLKHTYSYDKKEYNVKFNSDDFEKNIINGTMEIKDGDAVDNVKLTNVKVTKEHPPSKPQTNQPPSREKNSGGASLNGSNEIDNSGGASLNGSNGIDSPNSINKNGGIIIENRGNQMPIGGGKDK